MSANERRAEIMRIMVARRQENMQVLAAELGVTDRTIRNVNTKSHKVIWVCNGRKRKGKDFCDGTRVPDTIIKGWGEIKKDIYIQRKDDKNGKKRYSYTGKKPKGADRA